MVVNRIAVKEEVSIIQKKGQTWSTDAMIAVGIFLGVIMIFVAFINYFNNASTSDELKTAGEVISGKFTAKDTQSACAFIDANNQVDAQKLKECYDQGYDVTKDLLGLKYDFCFYLEDEQGNLMDLDNNVADDVHLYGIGSSDKVTFTITLDDDSTLSVGCGQTVCGNQLCEN